jgi:hypothetical protein
MSSVSASSNSGGGSGMATDRIFPPLNYAAVEDGLYRSALPSELNYGFVKTLHVKVG